ncbi:MAG: TatD family hydrolase [Bacteriovoracaceae bacterium]
MTKITSRIHSLLQNYTRIYVDIHSHKVNQATIKEDVLSIINLRLGHDLLQFFPKSFYSIGIHPWDVKCKDSLELDLSQLEKYALLEEVIAIGESGLDRVRDIDWSSQKEVFLAHMKVAKKVGKPLIIHAVRSHSDILQMLKVEKWEMTKLPLIHHDFRGNIETVKQYKNYHCYFSYGQSLWHNGDHLQAFLSLPIEQIFLETDDQVQYGIEEIYYKAAELRRIKMDDLKLSLMNNFFNLIQDLP